ncbi:type I restriction enzyme EcoKI subunit R [Maioricimonas rarisocia]|uniref:Type I restriction enzyme EcoKI subunit R n=1 Tax=Maioricimonas rarisocia TaxID=2528026 RepID=A0A517ZEL1_9PLAN|nr:DUF3427 domain-containing protein [Maioricimonas rarisocia]QDU40943.1 type I restriction enzyme EcoKI subunit R [Maioricimonas rarisocia]
MTSRANALVPGLYDQLVTDALQVQLDRLPADYVHEIKRLDAEESHSSLADFLRHYLEEKLRVCRGPQGVETQRRIVERVIDVIETEIGGTPEAANGLPEPLATLKSVSYVTESRFSKRPDTPLSRSALLTGTRVDPSLASQLGHEISSCDRVDILCSFIKWSGLRLLIDELRSLASKSAPGRPRIRVITTSYMGATDVRAIDALSELPNTEIRVSYDTKRTRLHAKAYIFHRETGFGSAYVGSANMSRSALSEGLEWTTKVSQHELPHLWEKITGTFETYWADDEFEEYSSASHTMLARALQQERTKGTDTAASVQFDIHPYPFQQEILDTLAAERDLHGKDRHLVVAATGTGKTVIAAFDYLRVCRSTGSKPSLLFIAHREEILQQAQETFRTILRDQNFGDLCVGQHAPQQRQHLFCSIQSYNSRGLWQLPRDHFAHVVVDEFHHAAAQSYERLLSHVSPRILVGLTATPERTDGLDVLKWFGGATSAEIRLPDAINRRLLCPFQYFGVADSVDLSEVKWQRGAYMTSDLDRVLTGNDVRARLVVDKVREIVLDPLQARGLGFCVSVAHAQFMAEHFTRNRIPSVALSGDTDKEERFSAQQKLRSREINFIFTVDLYNEGVDLPEVDTILFLRPTESLTVYLQQFGRGLRLHEEKDYLTVLDFIGEHRREFRFAPRLRALCTDSSAALETEIEHGMPHLPSGCFVKLERVAKQRVLKNIRDALKVGRSSITRPLRELEAELGRTPRIDDCLARLELTLDQLLRRGMWSRLLAKAGLSPEPDIPDEELLARGWQRLSHINDPRQLQHLLEYLQNLNGGLPTAAEERCLVEMLHVTLWGKEGLQWTLGDAHRRLQNNPGAIGDLRELFRYLREQTRVRSAGQLPTLSGPLTIHASYTRDEALVALGHWSMSNRPAFREGTIHLDERNVHAMFVTLLKTEEQYSPTTMYEDYLISPQQFHWQTQSRTSATSPLAQRYFNHKPEGTTPLLFVRERKRLPSGRTSPYVFLGPCEYVSHEGSTPVNIIWKLEHEVPARLVRVFATQRAS